MLLQNNGAPGYITLVRIHLSHDGHIYNSGGVHLSRSAMFFQIDGHDGENITVEEYISFRARQNCLFRLVNTTLGVQMKLLNHASPD